MALLFIEGDLTIRRVQEMKDVLLARLAQSQALEVDLAGVTDIDTAGVQLLLMARRAAQASGKDLRLSAYSPAVAALFGLLRIR
ncbi:STAS domain-containing protein [Pseudoduganella eburnea]|uniref:STAS domain-containing protein n=1 Tax=Massilia eburnea TaxID=1776165 RepID=A0A6L6QQT5_9BURK|nr:STAS domain-containing protein [Massilia eburnea]MTW14434.1 STAS domain-containing protein [Massilia eburnea]